MPKMVKIFALIMLFLFVLIISKNLLVEVAIEGIISDILGVKARISSVNADVLESSIKINDLNIFRRGSNEKEKLAYFPEIYFKVDMHRLLKRQICFNTLSIYLSEIILMKDKNGVLIIHSLKCFKDKVPSPDLETTNKRVIFVNKLHLKADKVYYGDYSKGTHPEVYKIDLNFDKNYNDVKDLYTLIKNTVTEIKRHNKMTHIFGIPVNSVKGLANVAYKISESTVGTAVEAASGGANDIFNKSIDKTDELK